MSLGLDFGTTTTVFSNAAGIVNIFGQDQLIPSVALHNPETGEWQFGKQAVDSGLNDLLITNLKSAITLNNSTLTSRDARLTFDADLVITRYLEFLANELRWDQEFGSTEVRMSCPAFWDKEQRNRLIRCATAAGFILTGGGLLDEPVSAAVGWLEHTVSLDDKAKFFGRQILVFDMGGGTLDLALIRIDRKGQSENEALYRVAASCGSNMAGNAVDLGIAKKIYDFISTDVKISGVVDRNGGVKYFLPWARDIKEALSNSKLVTWTIPVPMTDPISFSLSEKELRELLNDVFDSEQLGEPIKRSVQRLLSLGYAGYASAAAEVDHPYSSFYPSAIDSILLVGGMARMPLLHEYLSTMFQQRSGEKEPTFLPDDSEAVQEVVALGLGLPKSYMNLNLMRPDFDVVVTLFDLRQNLTLGSHVIWEAYSMPYQITYDPNRSAGFLFETKVINFPTPDGYDRGAVAGEISVVSYDGSPLKVQGAGGRTGLYYRLSENGKGRIKMSSSGIFTITDEGGEKTKGQLQVWPEPRIILSNENYKPDRGNRAGDEVG